MARDDMRSYINGQNGIYDGSWASAMGHVKEMNRRDAQRQFEARCAENAKSRRAAASAAAAQDAAVGSTGKNPVTVAVQDGWFHGAFMVVAGLVALVIAVPVFLSPDFIPDSPLLGRAFAAYAGSILLLSLIPVLAVFLFRLTIALLRLAFYAAMLLGILWFVTQAMG